MTMSDKEWQRVVQQLTTSDSEWYNEWQRPVQQKITISRNNNTSRRMTASVKTNDYEWEQVK